MALTEANLPHTQSSPGAWNSFFHYLFAGFNGIQGFLFPSLLVYWLKAEPLVDTVADLFGLRLHYVPLAVFLMICLFVVFIILKKRWVSYNVQAASFSQTVTMIISFHKTLLVIVISFALLFILSIFFKYFYGLRLPTATIALVAARILGALVIFYYHMQGVWLAPWQTRGHSTAMSHKRIWAYASLHPWHFAWFNALQIVLIYMSCRIYVNFIQFLYDPILYYFGFSTGTELKLGLIPLRSNLALVWDILLIAFAFILSNLFFIPLLWLVRRINNVLHPLRVTKIRPLKNQGNPI